VAVREVRASGLESLALATHLLHRIRLAEPRAGMWEAADLQWWWRRPRRSDEIDQLFWVDDSGPVAAVILTDWGRVWGCDPITTGSIPALSPAATWAHALDLVDALQPAAVETLVRDDDVEMQRLVAGSGFAMVGGGSGTCWMNAEDRPRVAALADGYTLVDRTQEARLPHPMRKRNGSAVAARLRQCSLYDPWLDLAIRAPHGEVAGYALFWHDPVTEVGLVEPMRVEDAYQRRGLARAMLTEGLERLAQRGASRMKVGYETDIARALYTGAGFRVTSSDSTYRRELHLSGG
jgi:ribosomal protein S18 acetylase RimI-like enzyme